jgi:hypothetical protein
VQDEQAGGCVAVVAEGVRRAPRDQQEVVRAAAALDAIEDERDRSVEHPEGLRAVHVPVRQRAAAARRHGPLHEGEVPAGLRRDGLERHHAPPRRDDLALPCGVPAPWQVTVLPSPGCQVTQTGTAAAVTLSPGTVACH